MKKLVVLAALALALGTVQQAAACDYGAHAANATPIVVASSERPTTQQPIAAPELAAAKDVAEQPAAVPVAPAGCNGSGC